MKILADRVLVKVNSMYDKKKGNLTKDFTYDSERSRKVSAIVTHIPEKLDDIIDIRVYEDTTLASPENYSYLEKKFKYISDISPEVEVGDRIYFYYNYLKDEFNKVKVGKTYQHIIEYNGITAAVRDGVINPIGGHILVKAIQEGGDKGGIISEKFTSERIGILKHKGTPLKGETFDIPVDTMVVFPDIAAVVQEIEGSKYYVMRDSDILGIIE